jgi:putative nucleotidyltransferase with HDIG domain
MHGTMPRIDVRTRHFPQMVAATAGVAVLPGLAAGALEAMGVIDGWWISIALAVGLSMAATALGSALWSRRPASHEVVFADLMAWAWLRRLRAERQVASARWLLGSEGRFGPELQSAMLERLSGELDARDARVAGHSKRVAAHAHMIAERMGLPASEAARIRAAATVHDVGKLETPQEILNKPGRLSEFEFAVIKRHATRGAEMVATLGDDELTTIVRHHHERLDGRGYPDGLRGEEIPLGARIIAVADTFDALTSDRPYRAAHSHKDALDVLRAEAGTQLDPDAVDAFLTYYTGRGWFPWLAVLAGGPSRLAAWAVSGVQGVGAAPLAGGAAALGASLVLGGGTLTSLPVERDQAAQPKKVALASAGHAPTRRHRAAAKSRRHHAAEPSRGGGMGTGVDAESSPSPQSKPGRQTAPTPPSTSPRSGSTTTTNTSTPSTVVDTPDVPGLPKLPDVPQPSALPPVQVPGLPQVQLPQVQLPQVQLPSLGSP